MRDPTPEEVFVLRRVARIINTTSLREDLPSVAITLNDLADFHGAPDVCEGCPATPAVTHDMEGVPLCDACAREST